MRERPHRCCNCWCGGEAASSFFLYNKLRFFCGAKGFVQHNTGPEPCWVCSSLIHVCSSDSFVCNPSGQDHFETNRLHCIMAMVSSSATRKGTASRILYTGHALTKSPGTMHELVQNHRIFQGWKDLWDHLVQPCQLDHGTSNFLNTTRDVDSTTSLGCLFQYLTNPSICTGRENKSSAWQVSPNLKRPQSLGVAAKF